MRKLGLLDEAMYKMEASGMSPIYMGGAFILDPTNSPFPTDTQSLADHIAACMEDVPMFRQKLVQDPLKLGDIKLVDDPDFDINNHVVVIGLAKPGGYKELTDHMGAFSAHRMDLDKPLWRVEVIDGLKRGKLAIAIQIHHAILDGEAAVKIFGDMWDDKPVAARKPKEKSWESQREPTTLELLSSALVDTGRRVYIKTPAFLLKNTAPLLKKFAAQFIEKLDPQTSQRAHGITLPKVRLTSLNSHLSEKRAVSYVEIPLNEVKKLHTKYNCSINDLALALCSFSMQHYFNKIGERIDFDLVALMAISLREAGDDTFGNKVSSARVNLYNATIPDLEKRLEAINKDTRLIKSTLRRSRSSPDKKIDSPSIDYLEFGSLFSPIFLEALFLGIVKFHLLERIPLLNTIITNVPFSPEPRYMAGARLVSLIPMAPVTDTAGMTMTISSTDENFIIGFHGCGEAIKNKELFVEGVEMAFQQLKLLAKKPKQPGRTKASKKVKTNQARTRKGSASRKNT